MNQVGQRTENAITTVRPGRLDRPQRIMCTEMTDNVLLPTVQVARVNRREEAKRHGGRPHGVFEVVSNAITSQVPPDPDPGDDMLLERSANNDHTTGQAIGKPRTRTQPCQTPKHRTIQGGTDN